MCWLHQHASSVKILKMISSPVNSTKTLLSISRSPKPSVVKSSSKTTATSKDMVCLIIFSRPDPSSETRVCFGGDCGFHGFFEVRKRSTHHCHVGGRGNRQQFLRVIMRISENSVWPAKNGLNHPFFRGWWAAYQRISKPLTESPFSTLCLGRSKETLFAG